MKKQLLFLLLTALTSGLCAQDSTGRRGFKKENLFTGGSVSLSFGSGSFLAGVNPVLGYSIAKWLDAGIAVNYTYASQRGVYNGSAYSNDKLHSNLYGAGVFTRLFPVRFLFAQVQVEHNFINNKYIFENGSPSISDKVSATSTLVGAGYTTGRQPGQGKPFGYLAILFDLGNDQYSPYKDEINRSTPIIRAGINIPLFQGRREEAY